MENEEDEFVFSEPSTSQVNAPPTEHELSNPESQVEPFTGFPPPTIRVLDKSEGEQKVQMSKLEEMIAALATQINLNNKNLEAQMNLNNTNLKNSLASQLKTEMSSQLNELNSKLDSNNQELLNKLDNQNEHFSKDIADLRTLIDSTKTDVSTHISEMKTQIVNFNTEVKNDITTKFQIESSKVEAILNQNKADTTELCNTKFGEMQKGLNEQTASITGIETKLNTLHIGQQTCLTTISEIEGSCRNEVTQISETLDLHTVQCSNDLTAIDGKISSMHREVCELRNKTGVELEREVMRLVNEKLDVSEATVIQNRCCTGVNSSEINKLPVFGDRQSIISPVDYLNRIEAYTKKNRIHTTTQIIDVLTHSFKDNAKIWFNMIETQLTDFESFKVLFLNQFWNHNIQEHVRSKLESGRYNPAYKCSMSDYFLRLIVQGRFLDPKPSDEQLIKKIVRHLPKEIEAALRMRSVTEVHLVLQVIIEFQLFYDRRRGEVSPLDIHLPLQQSQSPNQYKQNTNFQNYKGNSNYQHNTAQLNPNRSFNNRPNTQFNSNHNPNNNNRSSWNSHRNSTQSYSGNQGNRQYNQGSQQNNPGFSNTRNYHQKVTPEQLATINHVQLELNPDAPMFQNAEAQIPHNAEN